MSLRPSALLGLPLALAFAALLPGLALRPTPAHGAAPQVSLARVPLYFVENQGQSHASVRFYTHGSEAGVYFSRSGITFSLAGEPEAAEPETADRRTPLDASSAGRIAARPRWALKVDFAGANPGARIEGVGRTDCVFGYFQGPQSKWKSGVPSFHGVRYRDLWPGIDLVYRGEGASLKYDFIVRPGADPAAIRMRVRGAGGVRVDEQGRLRVATPVKELIDDAPVSYSGEGAERAEVSTRYVVEKVPGRREGSKVLEGHTVVSFALGEYDRSRTLVIDPAYLVYCGFIGGSSHEWVSGVAVSSQGAAYVCGSTGSGPNQGFPVNAGPDLTFNGGALDAFVAMVRPSGTALAYCGYIGGTENDVARGVAVDAAGSAYVCGSTFSSETAGFPVLVGPDLTINGPQFTSNGFVAKVDKTGANLLYCGYIGGANQTQVNGIAVDGQSNAYVCGMTQCTQTQGFPLAVGPDLTYNGGGSDPFVAKVAVSGASLDYCGYIGGGDAGSFNFPSEIAYGIDVDAQGAAYVCGESMGFPLNGFPTTVGPDLTFNGFVDAFIAKVEPGGASLAYCSFIGGTLVDRAKDVAVDSQGAAYVCGETSSSQLNGFPVTVGPDLTFNGGYDAFIARVEPDGSAFGYCGYLGGGAATGSPGGGTDTANAVAVDGLGRAHVSGSTSSTTGFPAFNGFDQTFDGGGLVLNAFVSRVRPDGTGLAYSTYLGSANQAVGIASDTAGTVYVAGGCGPSSGMPVLVGPDLTPNGVSDTFIAKIGFGHLAPPTGFTATALSHNLVLLAWSGGVSAGGGGFKLERRIGKGAGSPFEEIATLGPKATSYEDRSVAPSTTYTYRAFAFDAMGPSPYSEEVTVTTSVAPPSKGRLSLTPKSLNLGKVKVGRSKSKTLKIRNVGAGPLAVSIAPLEAPFGAKPTGNLTVAPKETVMVDVTFTPTEPGRFKQTLKVTSDDPARPLAEVRVSGSGTRRR